MKICNKCEEEKELYEFYFVKSRNIYNGICKKCLSVNYKKYYDINRVKLLPRTKNRTELNRNTESKRFKVNEMLMYVKDGESLCTKCLIIKNKFNFITDNSRKNKLSASCKKCKNEYFRNKKNDDIGFKLMCNLRSSISESVKKNKLVRAYKTMDILGVSILEFRIYIENKFVDTMSWDNYGEWHLDHIIPISYAKTIDEIYKLSYYTNFQPLWGIDNSSKGNRYIG